MEIRLQKVGTCGGPFKEPSSGDRAVLGPYYAGLEDGCGMIYAMLAFLLSVPWDGRSVMFQLSGFCCRGFGVQLTPGLRHG